MNAARKHPARCRESHDPAGHRRPVDVDVKDVHEDGHPAGGLLQKLVFLNLVHQDDLAVRRGDDGRKVSGNGAPGVAEKIDQEERGQHTRQRPADPNSGAKTPGSAPRKRRR